MRIPRGFRFSGVASGLKPSRRDLALLDKTHMLPMEDPALMASLITEAMASS